MRRYGDESIFSFRGVGSPNSYDDKNGLAERLLEDAEEDDGRR